MKTSHKHIGFPKKNNNVSLHQSKRRRRALARRERASNQRSARSIVDYVSQPSRAGTQQKKKQEDTIRATKH